MAYNLPLSLHFISSWTEFWFVNKEPKYIKVFTFSLELHKYSHVASIKVCVFNYSAVHVAEEHSNDYQRM